MTKRRSHPCKEFVDPERLCHIIVGTEVERRYFDLFLVSSRKHDDGGGGPFPHLPNDLAPL